MVAATVEDANYRYCLFEDGECELISCKQRAQAVADHLAFAGVGARGDSPEVVPLAGGQGAPRNRRRQQLWGTGYTAGSLVPPYSSNLGRPP